jgi:hypothetical protein
MMVVTMMIPLCPKQKNSLLGRHVLGPFIITDGMLSPLANWWHYEPPHDSWIPRCASKWWHEPELLESWAPAHGLDGSDRRITSINSQINFPVWPCWPEQQESVQYGTPICAARRRWSMRWTQFTDLPLPFSSCASVRSLHCTRVYSLCLDPPLKFSPSRYIF